MQDRMLDPGSDWVEMIPGEGRFRIALIGDVDYAARGRLDEAYHALSEQPPGDVVADLAGTTFLDSGGLGFLVRVHRLVTKHGHQLTVLAPPAHVRRALMVTGLDRVLTITAEQPPASE
jgi:anti-sigma B factor antagonist